MTTYHLTRRGERARTVALWIIGVALMVLVSVGAA